MKRIARMPSWLRPHAMGGVATICLWLVGGTWANGESVLFRFDDIDAAIPDGSAMGLSDSRAISTPYASIESVRISLTISGGFNGDLYAQVTHGSEMVVLLNRVGRSSENEFGYSDSGLDTVFDDGAGFGDVHVYRATLFGDDSVPLSGMLTGMWAPDGRAVDPDVVVDSDARSALLSSFNGLDPNGTWTLFVADLDVLGQGTLESWSIEFQFVPEPMWTPVLMGACCVLILGRRRLRKR